MTELVSIDEACKQLMASRKTVQRLIDKGHVRSTKIGRLRRIFRDDLEDYIHSNVVPAGELITDKAS